MDLAEAFPPLGLRVEAGPVVLRSVTDDLLPPLIELSMAGIHDPDEMPFYRPWTTVPAEEAPANYVRHQWGNRANWSRESWYLELAVEYEGALVGCQGFGTTDYLITRTGETGSWLGRAYQGRGVGTAMRQAMCAFLFDHLGAEEITSASFADNPASSAVSRKVGYRSNGVTRKTRRPGEWHSCLQWVLTPENFIRGEDLTVDGVEAFRRFIGLDPD